MDVPPTTSHASSKLVHNNSSPSSNSPTAPTREEEANKIDHSYALQKASEMENLSNGVASLGLSSTARYQPPHMREQLPHAATASQNWSFKKRILAARSLDSEPAKPKTPSQDYLKLAETASVKLKEKDMIGQRPKLLVLDLNQTLLVRKRSTGKASKNATPRPYLSAFWEYICGSDEVQPGVFQRRFSVMVCLYSYAVSLCRDEDELKSGD